MAATDRVTEAQAQALAQAVNTSLGTKASIEYVDEAVASLVVVDPPTTDGLPDGTLIARTT